MIVKYENYGSMGHLLKKRNVKQGKSLVHEMSMS
jgi:hypothetical protein